MADLVVLHLQTICSSVDLRPGPAAQPTSGPATRLTFQIEEACAIERVYVDNISSKLEFEDQIARSVVCPERGSGMYLASSPSLQDQLVDPRIAHLCKSYLEFALTKYHLVELI